MTRKKDIFKEHKANKRNIQNALLETVGTRHDTIFYGQTQDIDPSKLEQIGAKLKENYEIGIPDDPNKKVYSVGSLMLEKYDDKFIISNLDKSIFKTIELDRSNIKELRELFKLRESNRVRFKNGIRESNESISDDIVFSISKEAAETSSDAAAEIKNLLAQHGDLIPKSELETILSSYELTYLLDEIE